MHEDPTRIAISFDPFSRRMSGVAVHGMTPFDTEFMSQITDDLYVGGCESGLILPSKIKHVVSLYRWERYQVNHELLSFTEVTMFDSDFGLDVEQVEALAAWVNICRRTGPTLVHCQAGLNRSNLVAGLALIRSGLTPSEAVALLRQKRNPAVLCNKTFERFLMGVTS